MTKNPHVRIDLPGGESYRESANYSAGRDRCDFRSAVGPPRAHDLLRRALSGAVPALAESGASFITVPSAFTRKTGEAHWHTLLARPRHRERLLHFRRGPGRTAREQAREPMAIR